MPLHTDSAAYAASLGERRRSVVRNIMIEKNDWRLQGQERYLKGVSLTFKPYSNFREEWDHDHCSFCNAKFMDKDHSETLHEGYATDDNYHWVCTQCFNDFKDMFEWKVAS